jgi:sensor histidine kinase regulating citrate/malate metabolism
MVLAPVIIIVEEERSSKRYERGYNPHNHCDGIGFGLTVVQQLAHRHGEIIALTKHGDEEDGFFVQFPQQRSVSL